MEPELAPEVVQDLQSAVPPQALARVTRNLAEAAAALEDDRPADALGPAEEVKRRAPRSRYGRETLGLVYYRLGRYKAALAELRAFRRMSGDSRRDVVMADCERALGRPAEARKLLDAVIRDRRVPEADRTEARIVVAGMLADKGDLDGGIRYLEKGPVEPRALEDHHLRLWYALGDINERAGRAEDARRWFDKVNTSEPDFEDVGERVKAFRTPPAG